MLESRLSSALRDGLGRGQRVTDRLHARIRPPSVAAAAVRVDALAARLVQAARRRLDTVDQRLRSHRQSLELVSPLAVLGRGYAIVRDGAGRVVSDEHGLAAGDGLHIRLARAQAEVTVVRIGPVAPPDPATPADD
jgi:exodeoxyribonuclease VII large subunit